MTEEKYTYKYKHMTLLIILAIVGWMTSLIFALHAMVTSWREKNKEEFYSSIGLFIVSIPFGGLVGWAMIIAYVKDTIIDEHFEK